jgi:ketosteroid isomerase-like protein
MHSCGIDSVGSEVVAMIQVVEAVQGAYAAFARGDIPAVLALLAPNARWIEAEGGPYGGVSIGPEAVLENVFMRLGAEWDGFTAVPDELVASGDTVVALGVYRGTFKATGKEMVAPFAHVWKFADGRVASFQQHTDTVLHRRATEA